MLLAVDLKTGHHLWEQGIPTDVISAPVVKGDNVYITCFDGTSIAFDVSQGKVLWKNKGSATSAPIAVGDQIILTKKEQHGQAQYEGLARVDAAKGEDKDRELLARGRADYLAEGQGRGSGLAFEVQKSLDSSVGFGSAPAAAKMATASKNVGVNSVAGGWAYQGSRAAHNQGSIFNAQGKYLNSINAKDGRAQWQAEVDGKSVSERSQVFSPPSLGRKYMYLASSTGSLVSVRQEDGQVGFAYSFRKPMVFQPALVDGNVYVGTGDGLLICLKTNEKDADGWYEWGGNAQHNK
jgi:outer membrane protein assembly factor BamB